MRGLCMYKGRAGRADIRGGVNTLSGYVRKSVVWRCVCLLSDRGREYLFPIFGTKCKHLPSGGMSRRRRVAWPASPTLPYLQGFHPPNFLRSSQLLDEPSISYSSIASIARHSQFGLRYGRRPDGCSEASTSCRRRRRSCRCCRCQQCRRFACGSNRPPDAGRAQRGHSPD